MSLVDYRSGRCTGNPFIMSNIMPNTDEVSNKYHLPIQMRLKFANSHGEEILGSAAAFRARSVERREELRLSSYNARSRFFWEKHNIPTTSWSSPNGPGLRMIAPVNSEPSTEGYIPVTRAQMVAAGRSEPATVCKTCRLVSHTFSPQSCTSLVSSEIFSKPGWKIRRHLVTYTNH